jgi:phosphotransferase system HPr (HPr) family protein
MRREVEIVNPLGLHARPAAEFVRWARRFQAEVRLIHEGQVFSAASILDLLSAHLCCGTKVTLEAVGDEEQAALERLSLLLLEFRDREVAEGCLRESPPP